MSKEMRKEIIITNTTKSRVHTYGTVYGKKTLIPLFIVHLTSDSKRGFNHQKSK